MKNTRYYVAAIAAFTIWGFFSLALKPLSIYPSLDILFYRVFFSAATMLPITLVFRRKTTHAARERFAVLTTGEKKGLLWQVLGGGLFLTGNWFFFIFVMNHISIKAASFAYLVCPVLTALLAYFILKEYLNKLQWTSVLLSLISCLVLAFNNLTDLLYSLTIALSYCFYLIGQRRDYGVDRFLILTLQVSFSCLLLLPFYPAHHGPIPVAFSFYELIFIIAIFLTILPLFLNLYALKGLRSSTVGILLYINPLLNFIIAILHFGERLNSLQLVAYGVIFFSVILFNLRTGRRNKTIC